MTRIPSRQLRQRCPFGARRYASKRKVASRAPSSSKRSKTRTPSPLRIARNLAIDEARSPSRHRTGDEEVLASLEAPMPGLPDPLLARAIAECRGGLPPKPAAALEARLEPQGAVPDIELAERLGMQLNTFQNFTRARKLLADCLGLRGIEVPQ
jgi:DNA-directed RNA polymerase specialized sigma24 family protein